MGGGWPVVPTYSYGVDLAANSGASKGVSVTTGASNVKGSWVPLDASTALDITRLIVMLDVYNSSGQVLVFDFAVATSGNEASGILIQNLVIDAKGSAQEHIELPVVILAGSRIACRAASVVAADKPNVQLLGFDTGFTETLACDSFDTYGYSGSGAISGIAIDPGATVNTKGAYIALTTSSVNDLAGFILGFDSTNRIPGAVSDGHALIDIAIGAAGSEIVIVANYPLSKNNWSGGYTLGPLISPRIWIPIKAGTRISARCQSAGNVALDRVIGLSLYGIRG